MKKTVEISQYPFTDEEKSPPFDLGTYSTAAQPCTHKRKKKSNVFSKC